MVFNLQMQVQLLLLEVEQAGAALDVEGSGGRADAVLGVAALGDSMQRVPARQWRGCVRLQRAHVPMFRPCGCCVLFTWYCRGGSTPPPPVTVACTGDYCNTAMESLCVPVSTARSGSTAVLPLRAALAFATHRRPCWACCGTLPSAGIMFSATQTVQLLYRCVLRLLGTPEAAAAAEEAFAQSAAWGASVEAILVARGVCVCRRRGLLPTVLALLLMLLPRGRAVRRPAIDEEHSPCEAHAGVLPCPPRAPPPNMCTPPTPHPPASRRGALLCV